MSQKSKLPNYPSYPANLYPHIIFAHRPPSKFACPWIKQISMGKQSLEFIGKHKVACQHGIPNRMMLRIVVLFFSHICMFIVCKLFTRGTDNPCYFFNITSYHSYAADRNFGRKIPYKLILYVRGRPIAFITFRGAQCHQVTGGHGTRGGRSRHKINTQAGRTLNSDESIHSSANNFVVVTLFYANWMSFQSSQCKKKLLLRLLRHKYFCMNVIAQILEKS